MASHRPTPNLRASSLYHDSPVPKKPVEAHDPDDTLDFSPMTPLLQYFLLDNLPILSLQA